MTDMALDRRAQPQDGALTQTWETGPGVVGWLSSVDHKEIGKRYLVTALVFLLIGGIEALIMRLQLARPNQTLLTPEAYNQLFTMHGVTMVFLYALPMLSGFSNFLWPLLLGARDMAFPRLNAFSYWSYLAAGIFIYATFFIGHAPDAGWFNYVPLAGREYDPGVNIDVYALGLIFLGVSTTVGAINFIVSLLRTRAPGMSVNRMPILVWGTLTASVANLFAVPALSGACLLLWLDRRFGMHFYDVTGGGQPLLWQHLFWVFGHPWVYALVLPAMGIVSDALPTFCRRPLVGYTAVALATVTTMVVGFGVWVHHMFATGLPGLTLSFFGAASMVIAIPSAVSVFAWLGTIWTGRPVFKTPFYYFAGFILLFVIGGVSGFMTAAVPLDWQLTDTYFVVAHLHYVLLGINVFPVIGGLYYWFPKFTGRMADERLGKLGFWVAFIGFNIAFLPMHLTGLRGMPRRVYTYGAGLGWDLPNLVTSIGAAILAVGLAITVINFIISLRRGEPAGDNPWDAATLEWSTPSPPPAYNFRRIPIIASRHPLWEARLGHVRTRSVLDSDIVLDHGRETLATTVLDAEADSILRMPQDSLWPLLLALALMVLFFALLWRVWWLAALATVTATLLTAIWLAPGPPPSRPRSPPVAETLIPAAPLPVQPTGRRASGWYGMLFVIATEAALFVYLLFSYFYLGAQAPGRWPPTGAPDLLISGVNTLILLASSVAAWWGQRGIEQGSRSRLMLGLTAALLLGVVFTGVQIHEWLSKDFTPATDAYGSLFYTITGLHIAHVVLGLVILACLLIWTARRRFSATRHVHVSVGILYWHFVDVVWLAVFTSLFLTPRLGFS